MRPQAKIHGLIAVLLLSLAVAVSLWPAGRGAHASELPSLYVFVNSAEKPHAMQKTLEAKMTGVEVTVFGRFRDFESALAERRPDAVVALRPVLDELGLPVSMQGITTQGAAEPYALLSVGIPLPAASAQDKTIGTVDLLGRTKMKDFIAKIMNLGAAPKVKLVTKTEDLLPLLQFQAADAVILPVRHISTLVGRSELPLVHTILPHKVGLVAAAALSSRGQSVLATIKSLDAKTTSAMGAELWQ